MASMIILPAAAQWYSVRVCVCVCALTSCERPAEGSSPFSLGRLSFGELQPETGVLLLLGDESGERQATCWRLRRRVLHVITSVTSVSIYRSQKGQQHRFATHSLWCVCVVTQCVGHSVFDSRRSTLFAGERALAGVEVFLQLVFHLQIGLRRW